MSAGGRAVFRAGGQPVYRLAGNPRLGVAADQDGRWRRCQAASAIQDSRDAIQHALELGINLFDTAQGCGFGVAEQLLGDALRRRARRED